MPFNANIKTKFTKRDCTMYLKKRFILALKGKE